jgi:heme exporter protein C
MKKFAIGIYVVLTLALMVWGYYQAIYAAPTDALQGELFRIIFYHVPSASVAFVFFAISLAGSIGYLSFRRGNPGIAQIADAWALAGAEVGVVFCTVVLITGPLWGRRAWGIWWTWDARLTTTLVLWLIYVSYLLLRRFAAGPQMQTLAAVLGIFGALDVPIVYMSNRWWRTQHPAPVFGGDPGSGMKDPQMLAAFGWNVLAWALWGLLILGLRYAVERQRQKTAELEADAALEGDVRGAVMAGGRR